MAAIVNIIGKNGQRDVISIHDNVVLDIIVGNDGEMSYIRSSRVVRDKEVINTPFNSQKDENERKCPDAYDLYREYVYNDSKECYNTKEIAAEYGLTVFQMYKLLKEMNVVYKRNKNDSYWSLCDLKQNYKLVKYFNNKYWKWNKMGKLYIYKLMTEKRKLSPLIKLNNAC